MWGRNPCIWQSYMDRFCTKWATCGACVVAPPLHTLHAHLCTQHVPKVPEDYRRSKQEGATENGQGRTRTHLFLGCEERGCSTDILPSNLCHVRLGHNVQTHPGFLAAYSDCSKTPNSQWLLLPWRLFRHQLCSSMDLCPAPYLFPWHSGFPGKTGAPLCSGWHFSLAHGPIGQQRHRHYFFPVTMDVVKEAKRLKKGEVRILIC